MTSVNVLTMAADVVMGQQRYEEQLLSAMLDQAPAELSVRRVRVRSVRSSTPGDLRLPWQRLGAWPLPLQRLMTGLAYPVADLHHRCDLRLPAARGLEVLTIHDTAWLRFGDEGRAPHAATRAVAEAAAVIAPSAFAADEVLQAFPLAKVRVIQNGVDANVATAGPLGEGERARLGLPASYTVLSGGATTRKNIPAALAAHGLVRERRPESILAVLGPAASHPAVLASTASDGVLRIGHVERALYLRVLAAAAAVLVPSLYEGFGFPAVEGMAAGVPVVATRRAAFNELCGNAAVLVEPTPAGLAEGLLSALDDQDCIAHLRSAGPAKAASYTWARSAAAHLEVYGQLARTVS